MKKSEIADCVGAILTAVFLAAGALLIAHLEGAPHLIPIIGSAFVGWLLYRLIGLSLVSIKHRAYARGYLDAYLKRRRNPPWFYEAAYDRGWDVAQELMESWAQANRRTRRANEKRLM